MRFPHKTTMRIDKHTQFETKSEPATKTVNWQYWCECSENAPCGHKCGASTTYWSCTLEVRDERSGRLLVEFFKAGNFDGDENVIDYHIYDNDSHVIVRGKYDGRN